jgi:hypothetical protein
MTPTFTDWDDRTLKMSGTVEVTVRGQFDPNASEELDMPLLSHTTFEEHDLLLKHHPHSGLAGSEEQVEHGRDEQL